MGSCGVISTLAAPAFHPLCARARLVMATPAAITRITGRINPHSGCRFFMAKNPLFTVTPRASFQPIWLFPALKFHCIMKRPRPEAVPRAQDSAAICGMKGDSTATRMASLETPHGILGPSATRVCDGRPIPLAQQLLDAGLETRFAGRADERPRRLVSSLRERRVGANVPGAAFAVGGNGNEIIGAQTLRVQLILDKSFARQMEDADRPQPIAAQIHARSHLQAVVPG